MPESDLCPVSLCFYEIAWTWCSLPIVHLQEDSPSCPSTIDKAIQTYGIRALEEGTLAFEMCLDSLDSSPEAILMRRLVVQAAIQNPDKQIHCHSFRRRSQ